MGIPNSPVVSKRKIDDVSTILDLVDGPSKKAHHPCRCGYPKCCGGPNEHIPRVDYEKDLWDYTDEELFEETDGEWPLSDGAKYDKLRKYLKQVYESEGFDFDEFPGFILGISSIMPPIGSAFEKDYKVYEDLAKSAIELYNDQNGTKFKVEKVEKVNLSVSNYAIYYMTFTAYDLNVVGHDHAAAHKIFQTEASICQVGVERGNKAVYYCKLKPGQ
ncbi:hypothetical protein OROHE_024814 [Orobanche hederae]